VQVKITSPDIVGFLPTHYKLRVADGAEYVLRDWELQGSEDGERWDVLSKHENDTSFSSTYQCRTFELSGVTNVYTHFRVEQKRRQCRLDLCNWEMYGFLPTRRGALKDALKAVHAAVRAHCPGRHGDAASDDNTHRDPMPFPSLGRQASELVHSDACPRPTPAGQSCPDDPRRAPPPGGGRRPSGSARPARSSPTPRSPSARTAAGRRVIACRSRSERVKYQL
jgi:hypothetical protein